MPGRVVIDGNKLRLLLVRYSKKQVHFARQAGLNKFSLNRWCGAGTHRVNRANLQLIADGLGITISALVDECGVAHPAAPDGGLSPAEQAIVKRFRELPPLEQAKVLVAFDEAVNQVRSSPAKRSQ